MAAAGADYSNWLNELDKYAAQNSEGAGGAPGGLVGGLNASSSGSAVRVKLSAVEQLEQEMKLLHWHKLANEAALKAALIRTKRLRKKDRHVDQGSKTAEKAMWMARIIEEEQMKPLEVTDDFIRQYEAQERAEGEKLEYEVQRHIENLQSLKQNLRKRDEEKKRYALYRKRKRALERGEPLEQPASEPDPQAQADEPVDGGVAASLNKLVELEKRIATLEVDGPPSRTSRTPGSRQSSRSARSGLGGSTSLAFRKKRVATRLDAPRKTVYSVQVVNGRRGAGSSSRTRRNTPGSQKLAQRTAARQARAEREKARGQRQGAIINNWMSERKAKQQQRRSRIANRAAQSRARATKRGYNMGTDRSPAKTRGTSKSTSRTRGSYAQRRSQRQARGPAAQAKQQFHEVRKNFEQAKERARRGIAGARAGGRGSQRGPGSSRRSVGRSGTRRTGAGGSMRTQGTRGTRGGNGKWANQRSRRDAPGSSFKFSTRGQATGPARGSQLGSSLRGGNARGTSRTRRAVPATASTRQSHRLRQQVHPRKGRAKTMRPRVNRSQVAQSNARKAATRRRPAKGRRAPSGRTPVRKNGFGGASRFKSKTRRRTTSRKPRLGGVSGTRVNGSGASTLPVIRRR